METRLQILESIGPPQHSAERGPWRNLNECDGFGRVDWRIFIEGLFTLSDISCGMELTAAQFNRIEAFLPVQRGNVSLSNLQVINAILYVAENSCKWRSLPKRFGNWHTIYTRMNRWAKAGVLDRLFEQLQHQQLIRIKIEDVSLDSTIVKVHPDGTGALKKSDRKPSGSPEADGRQNFIWSPRMLDLQSRFP